MFFSLFYIEKKVIALFQQLRPQQTAMAMISKVTTIAKCCSCITYHIHNKYCGYKTILKQRIKPSIKEKKIFSLNSRGTLQISFYVPTFFWSLEHMVSRLGPFQYPNSNNSMFIHPFYRETLFREEIQRRGFRVACEKRRKAKEKE